MSIDRRRALGILAGTLPLVGLDKAMAQVPAPRPASRPIPVEPMPPLPRLSITPAIAARVGRQVWINESGGRPEGVTAWNDGEDFPSLGIGHWIWFKAGGHPIFEESFPRLVVFIAERGVKPPAWLDKRPVPPCPWPSKAAFMRDFHEPRMLELRRFLLDSVPQQTQYLLTRAEASLPKMLTALASDDERRHLLGQLGRLVRSSPDLYPLIDYVNFKGEGISEKETRFDAATDRNLGWGLRWLLLEMRGVDDGAPALAEFSRAAKAVLDRRIRNHPPSQRWREGWHRRCDTYKRPLA